MLRVRLAGSLRLESGEREIAPPRSRRARGLLAYLAAHPGPHPRGELAARFWPDVLDESARASLRAALTELRRALGDEASCLVATRETVALESARVDVREFDELLAAGRVDEALAACRDDELLAGMDDEWVYELRRVHEGRREQAARRLAAAGAERAAAQVPAPAALARAAEEPFVGRADELERLRAIWRGVCARRTRRLVLLAGEPGVGKTQLALRFARDALEAPATVLAGRCSEEPVGAYEPFADVLRQIGIDAARALAGPAAGELDRLLGEVHAQPPDDPGARHRLFVGVDDVVTALAERRPVVLVLDDLHWADRPTLLLLGFLLRGVARPAPVLVAGTYRDTEIGRRTPLAGALADLRRDGGAERIAVRGLGVDEVGELAADWLGAEAGARVAADVHMRTAGNAFFVEEVLRGLAGGGTSVPEGVRHAVGARLARLSPEADALLDAAAVVGEVLDVDVLQAVTGHPAEELEVLLDELLDRHVVRLGDGHRVEFTHALVREAVAADINPLRRARLHRAAAEALRRRDEEHELEQIAHHLAEAGDERAAEYLRRSGERVLGMLAYEEAAELFARALEVTEGMDAAPLLLARGDALLRAGEPAAARACFRDAAALARTAGDAVLLARAALGHAGLGIAIIDVDDAAVALLEEALAALGGDEPELRSELLARLAVELYYAPSRDRSEALSAEAVAVARAGAGPRAVAAALNARHVALWRPDRLRERLETAEAMIEAARAAGDRELELQGRNWRIADLFEALDMPAWREEVRRHGGLAAELRMPAFTWYTPLWAAVEALNAGRYEDAARLRERARREGERAGDRNADLFAEMLAFGEAIQRRDWSLLNLALVEEKIAGSPAGMAWRSSYAWILAAQGDVDAAREQYAIVAADAFAGVPFDANWLSAMAELAEACAELGDPALAAPVYERLLPYADGALTAGRAVSSYGSTQRVLGALAAVLGRTAEAVERHEHGIARNEAAGYLVWAEHGRRALAALRAHATQ